MFVYEGVEDVPAVGAKVFVCPYHVQWSQIGLLDRMHEGVHAELVLALLLPTTKQEETLLISIATLQNHMS